MLRRLPSGLRRHCICARPDCEKRGNGFSTGSSLKTASTEELQRRKDKLNKRILEKLWWDWHLWQLFAACLPALGIVALVQLARSDIRKEEALLIKQRGEKVSEGHTADRADQKHTPNKQAENGSHAELQAKVATLEKALLKLQMQQLMQETMAPGSRSTMLRPVPTSQEGLQNDAVPTVNTSDKTTAVTAQNDRVTGDTAGTQAVTDGQTASREQCLMKDAMPDKQAEDPKLAEVHHSPNAVSTLRQYGHQYKHWALLKVKSWFSKQEQPTGKQQVQDEPGQ